MQLNDSINQLLEKHMSLKNAKRKYKNPISSNANLFTNYLKGIKEDLSTEGINLIDLDDDNNNDNLKKQDYISNNNVSNKDSEILTDLLDDLTISSSDARKNIILETNQKKDKFLLNESLNLKINMNITRQSHSLIKVKVYFIDPLLDHTLTKLTFSVAVQKTLKFKLEPQSGDILQNSCKDGISQYIMIENTFKNNNKLIHLKWKIKYSIDDTDEAGIYKLPVI